MPALLKNLAIFVLAAVSISFLHLAFSAPASAQIPGLLPSAPAQQPSAAPSENAQQASASGGQLAPADAPALRPGASRAATGVVPAWLVRSLPDFMRARVAGIAVWKFATLLFVFLFGLILRKVLQFILQARLAPLAKRFGAQSVSHIVDVFAGPGSILVVTALLASVYPQLGLAPGAEKFMSIAVRALAIFSIVLSLYRLVDVLADRMASKAEETESKLDDQLVPLVRKALKIIVVLSGCLFLLQNLDVNVGSLVAGLGIGGVAIALAAKDTIANFFGSLMIFVDRPFQIGDWVRIHDTEGIVEEVGFRSTRVRTFYNSLVTVPNAHFTEAAIDNMGLREYRRLSTVLNLTYDTTPEQMQAFVEGIRAIIVANPHTRKDYYEIHFSGFGAHSLDVMVYLFFKVASWSEELEQKHNFLLEVLRLAKELGVEFAFPTQTLQVEALTQQGTVGQVPPAPEPAVLENVITAFGPGGKLSRPASPRLTNGFFASTTKKGGGDDG